MPKSKSGGRLRTSRTQPQLFAQRDSAGTEVKYFGLVRDEALGDLGSNDKALAEVLKDIQDPAEAATLGSFRPTDLQVLDGVVRYDLKREDFEILVGSSISAENNEGVSAPLVNPRQRIADRIAQAERFAGRGTNYQGQGTVLYKYYVPETEPSNSSNKYSRTNLPPFFTEAITSTLENSADFIPTTTTQIANTHRIGYIEDGAFVPDSDNEYWWSGEYDHYMFDPAEYGDPTQSGLTNPKFPIVRDGNMKFDQIMPRGINTRYNWGLRFDAWLRRNDYASTSTMMRWAAQVNGHLRIDYFEKTGYNSTTGAVEGTWRTALNTADTSTHYVQLSKENPVPNALGGRLYYVQGGPSTALGAGTGTLPSQRSLVNGGALDLNETYLDREGNAIKNFNEDYVPIVIRFWYGQPSTDPAQTNVLTNKPLGPASFFIEMLDTNLSAANLSGWNDYSSQLRLIWNTTESAWAVDTSAGGSAAGEANFFNYNENFEILGYTPLNLTRPSSLAEYTLSSSTLIATKKDPVSGVTRVTLSISGISPANNQTIWVVARNRPFNVIPGGGAFRNQQSMWQRYIFNPNPYGSYSKVTDLLENVGANYAEPNPAKVPFEENLDLYKAMYGGLPTLSTYTSSRYDGMLPNSLTTSNTQRDYDYNHSKLLMIGRQKKGTVSEIGTTAPYSGKNLAPGETRKKGENYTFIEVVENAAGFGGNVIINAYPSNDLGVISTSSTTTYGKTLHMVDNTTTFSNPLRQNISSIQLNELPSDANFASTSRVIYEEVDGVGRLSVGTWNGTAFTYDTTGIIAQLAMGATSRNHTSKSLFLAGFTKGSSDYSFYGLIGAQRTSFQGVALTVNAGGTTITSSSGIFVPDSSNSNNNQYIGSEIYFPGDTEERRVTSYVASTGTVTFSPSKTAGLYSNCEVFYNHLQLGGVLPSNIADSNGTKTIRTGIIPVPSGGNVSARLIQIRYVFNSAHQFLRADGGAGLSFGETLYVKAASSPTQAQPFTLDTELPAPPADIVVPFGYDNTTGSSDPGLGGLCYPPYSIQNIELQGLARTDSSLYATGEGQFDVWWGGRIGNVSDLGQRHLYVTDKLMFDFAVSERTNLLSALTTTQKPVFTGSEYTHKLEVELNVGLPTNASTTINANIYNDVKVYSNNKPVKDLYYLFIRRQSGGNQLNVLSVNSPGWT
jgi:hypothetical protein